MSKNFNSRRTDNVAKSDTINIENYQTKIMGDNCLYTGSAIQTGDSTYILSGSAEIHFSDGRYYKGFVKQGTLTGDNAVFKYPNGDTYQGSFDNDHFSKGRYTVKKQENILLALLMLVVNHIKELGMKQTERK